VSVSVRGAGCRSPIEVQFIESIQFFEFPDEQILKPLRASAKMSTKRLL
jgi:hypothetical protein